MYDKYSGFDKKAGSFMGIETELLTVKDLAELWGISARRVQILCDTGRVSGAFRLGGVWIIPKGTAKPPDGRTKEVKVLQREDSAT